MYMTAKRSWGPSAGGAEDERPAPRFLGAGGRVKALTPKERYLCPETADVVQLVSASNVEKSPVLRVILTE